MLTRLRVAFSRARGRHVARRSTLHAPAGIAATLALALVGALAIGAPAQGADSLGSGVLNLSKSASLSQVQPGQQVLYTLSFGCSSTTTGCVGATITDPVPAPLTITGSPTVIGGGSTVTVTGNTLKVVFTDPVPNTTPASTGLAAGATGTIQVVAQLPSGTPKSADGQVLTNTATFTATNATTVQAAAPVTVKVPDVIQATAGKTWAPTSTQFSPGEASTVTLTGASAANIAATSLTIAEPADPAAAGGPFDFYDFSSFGSVSLPQGADQVQVIAFTAGGSVDGPVGATPTLPASVTPEQVTGLRIVFSSSSGATIAAGASGSVQVKLAQRSANRTTGASLAAGGKRSNAVTAVISTPNGDATSPQAAATQDIAPLTISVAASKSFTSQQLPAGESTTATLVARNTSTGAVTSLTVKEPGTGTFFTSEVGFGGFTSGTVWPAGATGATVSWTVNTGDAPADTVLAQGAGFPGAPGLDPGQYITGFQVVFTGAIASGASATLPFTVSTTTAAGPSGAGFTSYPNSVTVTGTNAAGTAQNTATANLDVYFPKVLVSLAKTIKPTQVIPGGTTLVELSAQTPTGTSSVRPSSIVITEPENPAASAYWNAFDATAIAPTSVPLGSKLVIRYTTNGTDWSALTTVDATSAAQTYFKNLDDLLPAGVTHADVVGLRFEFTDAAGFGQATNLKPAISFTARSTLRDRSGPTNPGTPPALTSYRNDAVATATGSIAGGPTITSDPATGTATVQLRATASDGSGGIGADAITAAKAWNGNPILQAQSGVTTPVTLDWGVQVGGAKTMTIQDGGDVPLSASAFQAFDLASIDPITPTQTGGATWDPLIRWDAVSKVELYDGSTWNDITSKVCTTAKPCDGAFPGYTLSTAERASTQGVRLTVVESPNREKSIQQTADPMAPAVGSGVASASAGAYPGSDPNGRTVRLNLTLRNSIRGAATDWVTADRIYNTPDKGVVSNALRVTATPFTGTGASLDVNASVTMINPTFQTKVTKSANPTSLVIPQPDIPQSQYPTTVYTTSVTNTSTSKTWQLRLDDPVKCVNATTTDPCVFPAYDPATNPFDAVTLTKIAITNAAGAETSQSAVSLLHRAADGTLTTETVAVSVATGRSAAQLADVVGVSLLVRGTNAGGTTGTGGTIASQQKATMTLTTQLRQLSRAAGVAPTPGSLTNTAYGTLHDDVYPTAQAADQQGATVTLASGNLTVATTKAFSPASTVQANPQDPIAVNLMARATGTIEPKTLVIEDSTPTFWNAFTLSGISLLAMPTGADRITVDARTGTGSAAAWQAGTPATTAALPAGVTAADVTGLRFTFTKANGLSFAATDAADNVRINVSLRKQLRDGSGPVRSTEAGVMPGETVAGTVTNTSTAGASYNDIVAAPVSATRAFTVLPGTATMAVEKTSPGMAASGKEVNWTLRFKNTGTGALPNPVVTDALPADGSLLFVPTNVPIYSTSTGGTLPVDAAKITRTFDAATGTIRFSWPAGSQLAPNETYAITISLQIKPGLAPSTVATNRFGVTNDRTLTACTALNSGNGRAVSLAANVCSTSNVVTTLSQGSFTASKGVRSDSGTAQNVSDASVPCTADTDGFYRYPCAAVSTVGGTDHWKLEMTNGGNVAASGLTAVDVFPYPGDVGVVDPSARGSVFTPRFNGDVQFQTAGGITGTRMDWYVTTDAKPCTKELTPGAGTCPAGTWLPSSALGTTVDAAAVTGVKLVFDFSGAPGAVLPAGGSLKVTYSTTNIPTTAAGDNRAPVSAPVTGVRAWDSFGFYPKYVSGSQPAGPQEPIKAGVILTGGPLQITKTVTGAAAGYAPKSFAANVSCTIDGVVVDLGGASTVTLSDANGYTARVEGIPVGAACAVTEQGAAGSYGESSRAVNPASVTIASAAGAGQPVPAGQSVAITNDYALTSLTVAKHVDTAATGGSFGPFSFTLACTSALGTSIPLAAGDAAFTLADGENRTIADLPVGASCVVTETDSDGAATAPNHVGIAFDGAAETVGDSATVTLTAASGRASGAVANEVLVTNHYAAGTLSIAKTVDGDAGSTYGGGTYTVHVECVYAGDQKLFTGDLTIEGGETVPVPGVFPAGTECSVVETATGGATQTTIDTPTVNIPGSLDGSVPNVTVNVTNTFSSGSVVVEKKRDGDGVATYGDGPFTAQLTCTWERDGDTWTIPLPDAGRVVLDAANGYTATVTGLIQGAHCDTAETATGGATAVVIAPAAGVTVPAGTPATVTVTNTFDTGSLRIVKKRVGDGVADFGAGPFTMAVVCTYDVDGVTTPIDLGADATLVLSDRNGYTATIDDLIAGASCAVTETDAGLASATSMDPADGVIAIAAGETATVTVTNTFAVGHLSISKSADRPTASVGDTIVYTIVVTNDGGLDAKDVVVTDHLPKGLKVVSTSPKAKAGTGTLDWTIQALAIGATAVFTVTTVLEAPLDTVNRASVTTPRGAWKTSTAAGTCGEAGFSCALVTDPPKPDNGGNGGNGGAGNGGSGGSAAGGPAGGGLASTGSDVLNGILWALGLVAAGLAAVAGGLLRRRSRRA
ncbi:DUF5979 domain-containing protein [Leifsonia sp. F6_8S_P_1B]|uniref:DUF5979 domain-containing protein n=1 Tax=Leifsonia williamsii TaxID=3035919 RepID=A0ABT8K9N3_9MICO|nr:DUF5979 domain-containing protein [Leifsonia williamsii]MDN4613531.1 DUF5979 domain-containing protein [Leifsonia williamsii]